MNFKDHFSQASDRYRQYRPDYPVSLFAWLRSVAPSNQTAWDCATGTGQAALKLAEYFDEVIATDASEQQISQAVAKNNIRYRVATETCPDIEDNSIDLITVAQALHWFDTEVFVAEARRVFKSDGVLAVWCYNLLTINPAVDAIVSDLYWNTLRHDWPAERSLIEEGYRSLRLPFSEIQPPPFEMSHSWQRDDLIGYLGTWSAVNRHRRATGEDPLLPVSTALKEMWPDNLFLDVHWPLTLRVQINGYPD